jgi:hypothetical protein
MSYKRLASHALHCLCLVFQFTVGGPLVGLILGVKVTNTKNNAPAHPASTPSHEDHLRSRPANSVPQARVGRRQPLVSVLRSRLPAGIWRFIPPFT